MNAREKAFQTWYDTTERWFRDLKLCEQDAFAAGWAAAQREAEAREGELRASVLAAHPTPPETRDPLDKARSLVEQLQNAAGTSERETNA